MLSLNDRFFTKEVVKTFFDLRIRVKYNIFRLKNLKKYLRNYKILTKRFQNIWKYILKDFIEIR